MLIRFSLKNLYVKRKRYLLILIAIIFGTAIMTILTGASSGMIQNMKDKAARYFSGQISITGYKNGSPEFKNVNKIVEAIEKIDLPIRTVSKRTIHYQTNSMLYFAGEAVRQRRLIGIDFAQEGKEFASLHFLSGSIEAMQKEKTILISESAAKLLGCNTGDGVRLSLTTLTGQYNTGTFLVAGIFRESSIFGYVAYLNKDELNSLIARGNNEATDIAIYLEDGAEVNKSLQILQTELSKVIKTFPELKTKNDLYLELNKGNTEETLALLTLDAHLYQFKELINAFLYVTYFVLVVFLLIVMVGILNTYRIVVYERTKEIGTMRAIGMKKNQVTKLFLIEAFELALVGAFLGFFFGCILLLLLSKLDLSFLQGAGLFLAQGHLRFFIDWNLVTLNIILITSASVLASFGPARSAATITPAQALRTEG